VSWLLSDKGCITFASTTMPPLSPAVGHAAISLLYMPLRGAVPSPPRAYTSGLSTISSEPVSNRVSADPDERHRNLAFLIV
jgi:hypothetical protein